MCPDSIKLFPIRNTHPERGWCSSRSWVRAEHFFCSFCVRRNARNKCQTKDQPLYLPCGEPATVHFQPPRLPAVGSSLCPCVCPRFYGADCCEPSKHLKRYSFALVLFVPGEDCKLTWESSRYFWYAVLEFLRHNSELGNCFMGYLANPGIFI